MLRGMKELRGCGLLDDVPMSHHGNAVSNLADDCKIV
jgi:hypothetical protein